MLFPSSTIRIEICQVDCPQVFTFALKADLTPVILSAAKNPSFRSRTSWHERFFAALRMTGVVVLDGDVTMQNVGFFAALRMTGVVVLDGDVIVQNVGFFVEFLLERSEGLRMTGVVVLDLRSR